MRYRFYSTTKEAWAAMTEAVHGASQSIYLESFIFAEDDATQEFFEALKERARHGVQIKIIIDRVGGFLGTAPDVRELQANGAEIIYFNRFFYRNHRKILIVDRKKAFMGGVNFGSTYQDWIDLHVSLDGRVVQTILRSFARVYSLSGGKDVEILSLATAESRALRAQLYKAKLHLIDTFPVRSRALLRNYYKQKCREAKKSITIVTPYFVPHRWLVLALRAARRRGVRVEILMPNKADHWLAQVANRTFVRDLEAEFTFLAFPEMIHAKVLLVDDREGLIGSNNIDALSFDYNLEASVVFQRKDMVGNLRAIIERWKKTAKPYMEIAQPFPWYAHIIAAIIRLIQPIL